MNARHPASPRRLLAAFLLLAIAWASPARAVINGQFDFTAGQPPANATVRVTIDEQAAGSPSPSYRFDPWLYNTYLDSQRNAWQTSYTPRESYDTGGRPLSWNRYQIPLWNQPRSGFISYGYDTPFARLDRGLTSGPDDGAPFIPSISSGYYPSSFGKKSRKKSDCFSFYDYPPVYRYNVSDYYSNFLSNESFTAGGPISGTLKSDGSFTLSDPPKKGTDYSINWQYNWNVGTTYYDVGKGGKYTARTDWGDQSPPIRTYSWDQDYWNNTMGFTGFNFTNGFTPDLSRTLKIPPVAAQMAAAAPVSGQEFATQWAFKKLGLPLALPPDQLAPTVVAVIDTGLDYVHPLLPPYNLWLNPEPGDGRQGFADDFIGWNFFNGNNNPWDDNGHGTFVAGLIVGVNPAARIMPLKVAHRFGAALASNITRAIIYAVDNGARVINISLGSEGQTPVEQAALDYAYARGVLVVVAAGNEGGDTKKFGPAGMRHAFAVTATEPNGHRAPFDNWGQEVAMAAPGVDIISWRARRTDLILVVGADPNYKPEANFVGQARQLYRATGTSFAAPLVAGAASLLWSRDPNLTIEQVKRMLLESADDIEVPGWDQYTGAGELNIAKALQADPNYFLAAQVAKVQVRQQGGQTVIQVEGTAEGTHFKAYTVQIGQGPSPQQWKTVAPDASTPVHGGLLATFPVRELTARGEWSLRVLATDTRGKTREGRGSLTVQ